MASRVFGSGGRGQTPPPTTTVNEAGGTAYKLSSQEALAQYAMTGAFTGTFYASAKAQLDKVLELAKQCDPLFVAKVAIYAWENGFMKDMSAFLTAFVSTKDPALLRRLFPRTITNGKQLRNFVQIIRSGTLGRKSLGHAPKRLIQGWFTGRSPQHVFEQSVGDSPSFRDILRMVHPKDGGDLERKAVYAWLVAGKQPIIAEQAPPKLRALIEFQRDQTKPVPDVDLRLLTNLTLSKEQWREVASNVSWQTLRMGLNEFQRRGVFEDAKTVDWLAKKLVDAEAIKRSRVFPYQLYAAWKFAKGLPQAIRSALHRAMDIAVENVPAIDDALIFVDCSGSMGAPVTGDRGSATTAISCKEVAALFAAVLHKRGSNVKVWGFGQNLAVGDLEKEDSILTTAKLLSAPNLGGTDCSLPMRHAVETKQKPKAIVYLSDNQSWIDSGQGRAGMGTATMAAFNALRRHGEDIKLVCVDLAPSESSQATSGGPILNIGGYSDRIFTLIGQHLAGTLDRSQWVGEIEKIEV